MMRGRVQKEEGNPLLLLLLLFLLLFLLLLPPPPPPLLQALCGMMRGRLGMYEGWGGVGGGGGVECDSLCVCMES